MAQKRGARGSRARRQPAQNLRPKPPLGQIEGMSPMCPTCGQGRTMLLDQAEFEACARAGGVPAGFQIVYRPSPELSGVLDCWLKPVNSLELFDVLFCPVCKAYELALSEDGS